MHLAQAIDAVVRQSARPGPPLRRLRLLRPGPVTAALRARRRPATTSLTCPRVVAADELEPSFEGDLTLEDAETGALVSRVTSTNADPGACSASRPRPRSSSAATTWKTWSWPACAARTHQPRCPALKSRAAARRRPRPSSAHRPRPPFRRRGRGEARRPRRHRQRGLLARRCRPCACIRPAQHDCCRDRRRSATDRAFVGSGTPASLRATVSRQSSSSGVRRGGSRSASSPGDELGRAAAWRAARGLRRRCSRTGLVDALGVSRHGDEGHRGRTQTSARAASIRRRRNAHRPGRQPRACARRGGRADARAGRVGEHRCSAWRLSAAAPWSLCEPARCRPVQAGRRLMPKGTVKAADLRTSAANVNPRSKSAASSPCADLQPDLAAAAPGETHGAWPCSWRPSSKYRSRSGRRCSRCRAGFPW